MKLRWVTWATTSVWIAAVAGGVAWLLPLAGKPTPVPPQAVLATAQPPAAMAGAERLLGTPPPAPVAATPAAPEESRFKLLGVIAPRRAGGSGLALISVDGQPARVVAVGREVDAGVRVIDVAHRRVQLGPRPGTPTATLELPPLAEPNRGVPGGMAPPPVIGAPGGLPGAGLPMVVPGANGPVPMPGVAVPGPTPGAAAMAGRQRVVPMFSPGSPGAGTSAVPMPMPSSIPGVPVEQQADTGVSPSENRVSQ